MLFDFLQDTLDASYRGVKFYCEETSDSSASALAVHEYPFRDGGELDDMGRKTRRYKIKAIFFGDGYKGKLETFVEALDECGEGELVHPIYGTKPVMVEEFSIQHEAERPDSCTVQITFAESGQDNPFFAEASTAGGMADNAITRALDAINEALDEATAALQETAADILGCASGGVISEVIGTLQAIASVYNDVVDVIGLVVDYISYPLAFVAGIRGAVDKVLGFASGGAGMGGKLQAWKNAAGIFKGISLGTGKKSRPYNRGTAPADKTQTGTWDDIVSAPGDGITDGTGQDSGGTYTAASRPSILDGLPPLDTPQSRATAAGSLIANIAQTGALVEAVADMLEDELDTPILSPIEIEAVVADTRERLQDCIEGARAVLPPHRGRATAEALRNAALAVQDLGRVVLQAKPPLCASPAPFLCNHHLIAHALHGNYARASEILRLNPHIRMPNRIRPGTTVAHYKGKDK